MEVGRVDLGGDLWTSVKHRVDLSPLSGQSKILILTRLPCNHIPKSRMKHVDHESEVF
jgi:hypothetical protein